MDSVASPRRNAAVTPPRDPTQPRYSRPLSSLPAPLCPQRPREAGSTAGARPREEGPCPRSSVNGKDTNSSPLAKPQRRPNSSDQGPPDSSLPHKLPLRGTPARGRLAYCDDGRAMTGSVSHGRRANVTSPRTPLGRPRPQRARGKEEELA